MTGMKTPLCQSVKAAFDRCAQLACEWKDQKGRFSPTGKSTILIRMRAARVWAVKKRRRLESGGGGGGGGGGGHDVDGGFGQERGGEGGGETILSEWQLVLIYQLTHKRESINYIRERV